jgi:hypothetical protein
LMLVQALPKRGVRFGVVWGRWTRKPLGAVMKGLYGRFTLS